MEDKLNTLCVDDTLYCTKVPEDRSIKETSGILNPYEIRAIIPGTVVELMVKKGQKVSRGQVILILEAMKMYNELEAEIHGNIEKIYVSSGDKVEKDRLMVRIGKL